MGIDRTERRLLREPRHVITPVHLPARGYLQALDKFPVGKKRRILLRVLKVMAEVKVASMARDPYGLRYIQHVAVDPPKSFERQCSLSTAGAAGKHEWRGFLVDCLLDIVVGQHIAQQMDVATHRMQVAYRCRIVECGHIDVGNPLDIDRGATQETRLF